MSIFGNFTGSAMDEIRCDESDYLIWKWRPRYSQKGKSQRENAIRWGSSLRVRDGSVAVFVYDQHDGTYQDFIQGPCDQIIQTTNLPVLASIAGLAYDGGTPFQAEVYFINLAKVIQAQFAIPFFNIYDPRFPDFGVPVAIRGALTFHIGDYKEFIKLHRLDEFSLDEFRQEIRHAIIRHLKPAIANAPTVYGTPLIQIERNIGKICDDIDSEIKKRMSIDFGINVTSIDISTVEFDEASDGYQHLMAITRDVTMQTIQAQTEASIKDIHDKQRIIADDLKESLRIQREESQYAQHKQTQSSNFAAYQLEQQATVGIAGAHAFGQMGANDATRMTASGGNAGGMDPAAMVVGMSMGGVLGQNMASVMSGMFDGLNQPIKQNAQAPQTPPPIPAASYHVAINGGASGPFDMSQLASMVAAGMLSINTFVWTTGMSDWRQAGSIAELDVLFQNGNPTTLPPIPGPSQQ